MISKRLLVATATALVIVGVFAGLKVEQELNKRLVKPVVIVTTVAPVTPPTSTPLVAPETPEALETPETPKAPSITAEAYLVGDIETGHIYLEHNSSTAMPVASMSKLVTALAASMAISSSTRITITKEETDVPPDSSNIGIGETYSAAELLYPLLLSSSNIAAEALASSTNNKANFLDLMSSYAWEIGMPQTFFADSFGVSIHNEATAKDIFALAQYLYKYRPDILTLTRIPTFSLATTTDHGSHIFASTHPFVNDTRFIGGKTGRTPAAGETMLTILGIEEKAISFIVLGSDIGSRASDTYLLIKKYKEKVGI